MTKEIIEQVNASDDIRFMRLALREARKGVGRTSPNPCVGAIVVQNQRVISRGYHKKAGTPHAEIHALRKAGNEAAGATLYVTLEPCSHTGRTPPCSHAVAAAGIKRVVVGMEDPNPLVKGSGNRYLREQGIDVVSGILEEDCRELNLPFIKHISSGLPFVVMKAGMSLDGKISYQQGQPGWMTGESSARKVHGLRNSLDAILVGRGTIDADDPSLTTRLPGKRGRDPVRVILDSRLQLSLQSRILCLDSLAPTILFCSDSADAGKMAQLRAMDNVFVSVVDCDQDGGLALTEVLAELGKMGICSLLVEGGAAVHGSFLKKGLVDRVFLFMAPLFAGSCGTPLVSNFPVEDRGQALKLKNIHYRRCGSDMMVQGDLFESAFP